MPGTSFENMPLPKRPYLPGYDTRREDGKITFESLRASLMEDKERATLTKADVARYPNLFGDPELYLAKRLMEGVETGIPSPTLASHLYFRQVRKRVIGALWPLVEKRRLAPAVFGTLRPTGMWVPANDLVAINPHTYVRRLEADLHRRGFTKMKGYLLAGLHAEFDENRGGYDFHHHLIAGGEMAENLDQLRNVRRLKAGRVQPHEKGLPASARVHLSRKPLYNLPDPLTYILQSSVPHRPTTRAADGTLERGDIRRRIPAPHHTHWLLWMDRWSVSDFVFCIGRKPTSKGFRKSF